MRNTFILISLLLGACAAHNATGPLADVDAGADGSSPNVTLLYGDTNGDGVVDDRDDADAGSDQDAARGDGDASLNLADGAVPAMPGDGGTDAGSVTPDAGETPDAGASAVNQCGGIGDTLCNGGSGSCLVGETCAYALGSFHCNLGFTYVASASHKWECSGPNDLVCPACVK